MEDEVPNLNRYAPGKITRISTRLDTLLHEMEDRVPVLDAEAADMLAFLEQDKGQDKDSSHSYDDEDGLAVHNSDHITVAASTGESGQRAN
eukprot:SAG11_NODE_14456_length_611_cov_1.101562_1_plen_91_part_00